MKEVKPRATGVKTPRLWDIWVEGHGAQGTPGPAWCAAQGVEADTFEEAVAKHVASLTNADKSDWTFDRAPGRGWEFWGCQAFPDEASARRSFG